MWTFDSDTEPGVWVAVESPTNATLRDLTATANGPVAVGDRGVAIGRGANRWGVILDAGPGARSRTLHAVDATDDGERVYFAGAGGAFGYYDLRTEQRRDHSVPRGNANAFYSLTVAGDRGEEKFLVGDGSGNVVPGRIDDAGEVDWDWATAPNSGNALEALAHDDAGYGYAVDVNSTVYVTTADEGWETIGIDDAQGSFYDCAFGDGRLLVGGGNGMAFESADLAERDGDVVWTPTDLGEFAIYGLDAGHGAQLACGESGNVLLRAGDGEWRAGHYDGTQTLRACLLDEQMVAVGSSGLIVERRDPDEGERADDAAGDDSTDADDAAGDADTSTEWVTHDPNAPDESTESGGSGESGDGTTDDGWSNERTDSADGDSFDGRGENYDGDGVAPGESAGSGDSGNDPADEPDEPDGGGDSGNDAADPPDDGGSGDDGSDPADEDTDSDADSPDR